MSSSTSTSLIVPHFSFSAFFLPPSPHPPFRAQISLLKQSLELQLSQSQAALQQLQSQFNQERELLSQQLKGQLAARRPVSLEKDQSKAPPTDLFYFEKAVGGSSSR